MDAKRLTNAQATEPESMSVGELNQAVKDLRELLYQARLMPSKRFIRFDYDNYYPAGGADDIVGAYNTFEEATKARPECGVETNRVILDTVELRTWYRDKDGEWCDELRNKKWP